MPTVEYEGETFNVYPAGTYVRYQDSEDPNGWVIYRIENDEGNHMTVVACSDSEYYDEIGYEYRTRGEPFQEARPDNDEDDYYTQTLVTPCDCPRHQGTPVFHEVGIPNTTGEEV